jgi:poly-beta-1,6-N-acetyl-D-glucosamine synthase
MTSIEVVFWVSLSVLAYAYAGYPAIVLALGRFRAHPTRHAPETPTITVVIAAHNEERAIAGKIENCLGLAYPPDRLNLVVVSDGSTDRTATIVGGYATRIPERVTLVSLLHRRGKAHALNVGVARASGEIVLFADARQHFDAQVARALTQNFADSAVGAVSGELMLRSAGRDGQGEGLGLYWRYEKAIRQAESRWGSTMGYTGAVSAVRRSLFDPLAEDTLVDDLVTPLRLIAKGYRVVFEPRARAYDTISALPGREFARKVRTLAGVLQTCLNVRTLVGHLPPWAWWQLVSHKLLRLLVPYLLVVALVASALVPGRGYRAMLLAQVTLYALGVAGLALPGRWRRSRILALPATFLLLNSAAVVAAFRYMIGGRLDLWRAAVAEPAHVTVLAEKAYADLHGADPREREGTR